MKLEIALSNIANLPFRNTNLEPEDIDVVRIGWLGTRWLKWMHRASRNWSNQSRSMISMDIEQMARLMMFEGDFKKLPAASSNWRCLNCPFNADCH